MESLNSNVRRQMELMRQNLDKLRSLAAKQKTAESKKMLLADTESHADELVWTCIDLAPIQWTVYKLVTTKSLKQVFFNITFIH